MSEALFSTRCRQVSGEMPAADAAGWLSGLLVAADVRDAGARLRQKHRVDGPVTIVGEPALASLYARAMRAFGLEPSCRDGEDCALAGLAACRALQG